MARYAIESSKQLASGLINLGDMSYRTLSKYCHELLSNGSSSQTSLNSSRKSCISVAHSTENANAGMVVIKDFGITVFKQILEDKNRLSIDVIQNTHEQCTCSTNKAGRLVISQH